MKAIGRYLVILILVMVLWNTIVIKPLKLFTVFLHELGHAFMAFIFGSGISGFKVNLNESGHTLAKVKDGFPMFMVANAGYLGSILFALFILYLKRTAFKKYIIGFTALLFLFISIKYSGFDFTLLYSIIFAGFALIIYMINNDKLNEWIIDIIGISSAAYAIYDTFVDTILLQVNAKVGIFGYKGNLPKTDAVVLENITHIPAIIWGVIWLAIALMAVYVTLLKSPKGSRSRR